MERYDSYKDSGVKWLGEIPSHWECVKLKSLCSMFGRIGFRGYSRDDLVDEGEGAITLSPSNFVDGYLNYSNCSYLSWKKYYESPEIMVENGDIVFVKTASIGKVAIVKNLPEKTTINPQILVFKHIKCNASYLNYYLQSKFIQGWIVAGANGSTISTISQVEVGKYPIFLAPFPEQEAIAIYLDSATSKIDEAIAQQQKMIDLLNERKQIIINNAVTKGLDPNVKMKPSGIDWIGDIPEHWNVIKASYIYNHIGSGSTPKSGQEDYYTEDGLFFLQTGDLNDGFINDTTKKITYKAIRDTKLKTFPRGSLVIAMYGATIGKLGILNIDTTVNQACCVLPDTKKMITKFTFYTLMAAKNDLILQSRGGGQPNISQDTIKNEKLIVPPINEQEAIVDYIDRVCIPLQTSIDAANKQISLLQERKQIIINDVVTGKVKVV